jgi:arsenate reductase
MFSHSVVSISTHHRASPAHFLSEIAAGGLILVIFALARTGEPTLPPPRSAPTSAPPTSSPARPASLTRRSHSAACSPTPSPGIAPAAAPSFAIAQIVGGGAAILTIRALYPDVTPAEASDVVIPQVEGHARPDGALSESTSR